MASYLLLFLAVFLGGGLALLGNAKYLRAYLPYLLSFSGAFLLGIAALELIPEIFNHPKGQPGIWLLAGFLLQLLLENLSQGVEHGHIHSKRKASRSYGIGILIGLCLHAFIEGLPLQSLDYEHYHVGHNHSHDLGRNLLVGVIMHKLPAAFALGLLLRFSDYSKRFVIGGLSVFALMAPLGAWLGGIFILEPVWIESTLALVVGSLLHISTTILFEADARRHHSVSWQKLVVIVVGLGVALVSV
ncbi:MAG: ZIP family metal transporter [Bacteroidota bacterium]